MMSDQHSRSTLRLPDAPAAECRDELCPLALALAMVTALWCVTPPAAAQEAGEGQETPTRDALIQGAVDAGEGFSEIVQVNVVNVEVYVIDKDGNPVTDLTADDFEIFEDGRKQEITNFYAVAGGRPVAGTEGVAPMPLEEPTRPGVRLPLLPPEQRLYLIVYVDNFNLRPASRNRTLRRVSGFLRSMVRPGDQIMVVSHDRSLHLRQPFTGDMNLVSNALDEVQALSGIMVDRDADRMRTLREIEDARDGFGAIQEARSYAESVFTEMEFSLRAMREQIDLLAGLTGRKALLYVSDGIPSMVGEDLFLAVDELHPRSRARAEAMAYSLDTRYRDLVTAANSAGVTYYALDAGGLASHSSVSAEFGGTEVGGGLAFIDTIRTANLREPLHQISDDTGGFAIVGTNAISNQLERLTRDFRNFYSLGYSATHFADGRYYKIEVKTKRSGLKIRHRNGYRDRTSSSRLGDGMIATLYYGAVSNPLDVEVAMKNAGGDGKKRLIDVELRVPIRSLTLAARAEHLVGSLRAGAVVLDTEGRVSPVQLQEPVTVAIPTHHVEEAMGKYYTYAMTLTLRPGSSRVVFALSDGYGGRISFLREVVTIE